MRTLTMSQARRLALGAQGFNDELPAGRVDIRHLRRVLDRIQVVQIDSVNVVARAHQLSLFSRLGAYPVGILEDAAYRRRELLECWAHEAAYVGTEREPLFRWRRALFRQRPAVLKWEREHSGYLDGVRAEVQAHGPLSAAELSDPGERRGPWWGWAKGKTALEVLFRSGELAVADRPNFTRRYDLAERVIPSEVLDQPTPPPEEAWRRLLLMAVRAHGIGTAADLCDYYRLKLRQATPLIDDLVRDGSLIEARINGLDVPVYLDPEATVPRRINRSALLCPFDPVIWFRPRAKWLFDFDYRIEIYTPAPKRVYGYYVFGFLQGERITARVDLKADRAEGLLRVRGAFAEDHTPPHTVAGDLAQELRRMAAWLRLPDISVERNGDLTSALATAI